MGLDPGTASTGWGLVELIERDYTVKEFGIIHTAKELPSPDRLRIIYDELLKLLSLHSPDAIAIERVFFATNAKTAIAVGQAQGVMFLGASVNKIPVFEYAPGTIKKVIAGNGRADKIEMQKAVRKLLGAKVRSQAHKRTHFDNTADALAVAVCHIVTKELI